MKVCIDIRLYTFTDTCVSMPTMYLKNQSALLITWFCPETKGYNFHWMYIGGRKKPRATHLLTCRKP